MRKIVLATGVLLGLSASGAAPVVADSAKPAMSAKPQQLALFQERSIFHSGLRDTHTVALTFDDGPNLHTGEVLDALKQMNIRATFFIVGRQAHRHPEMLARIAREGHLLANHSANHARLSTRYAADSDLLINEIRDVTHVEDITIEDDGSIFISGKNETAAKAKEIIRDMAAIASWKISI